MPKFFSLIAMITLWVAVVMTISTFVGCGGDDDEGSRSPTEPPSGRGEWSNDIRNSSEEYHTTTTIGLTWNTTETKD